MTGKTTLRSEPRRGEIYWIAAQGELGSKRRPAVVVASDRFIPLFDRVTVCLITSHLVDAPALRVPLAASKASGLDKPSAVMVDKLLTVSKPRLVEKMGAVGSAQLAAIENALRDYLEL